MKMPIPADWDGQSFCRYAICWPDSPLWKIILRGLVTEPTRGFFWDEKTGSIIGVLSGIRQTMDYNLDLECVIMSCNDATDLIEALNTNFATLVEAIAALQLAVTVEPANPTITVEPASPDINVTCSPDVNVTCLGGGSSGPGGLTGLYGQGPIIQPEPAPGQTVPGPGPGGYEPPATWPGTVEEYDAYKCQAANFLIDGYLDYVQKWQNNYTNLLQVNTLTSIVDLIFGQSWFLLFMSPQAAVVLVWYLATVEFGLDVSAELLEAYEDYLQTNKSPWICELYNAPDVASARTVCINYIGTFGALDLPGDFAAFHSDNLFTNSALNILFEEYGPAVGYEGTEDCLNCGCTRFSASPPSGPFLGTTITSEDQFNCSYDAGDYTDRDRYDGVIAINGDGFNDYCGPNVLITTWEVTSGSIITGPNANAIWSLYDHDGALVYEGSVSPTLPICAQYIVNSSAVAFSMHVEVEPCPE